EAEGDRRAHPQGRIPRPRPCRKCSNLPLPGAFGPCTLPRMAGVTLLQRGSIRAVDYRCAAGPADAPFVERPDGFSVPYVREGSFGYGAGGGSAELVAGSLLVGHPGDEYLCTHDHVTGDECLSFHLSPARAGSLGGRRELWGSGCVPPLPELMVLGELAQA